MGEGWGDEITSPLLFLIFQPLPTLFLTSFHEFLKIHQCEVRRGRETCWWRGWEGGRQREGCVSQALSLSLRFSASLCLGFSPSVSALPSPL